MSPRRVVALGLASALLAGDWTRDELVRRGRRALGQRPRWLGALVRDTLAAFPDAPCDRRDELADFVEHQPLFARAFERGRAAPRIVRFIADAPAMGRSPWNVPELATNGDLARFLALEPPELDWLADCRGLERCAADEALRNYRYLWWPKPTVGVRVLEAPKSRLKALQRRVLHDILDRIPPHPAAHGFCRGRSTLSFAAPHAGSRAVVRCDLEDFFASVRSARVFGIWRSAGYPEAVARTLTALCTNRVPGAWWRSIPRPTRADAIAAHWRLGKRLSAPHLPQGAPTSPALANLCAYRLDVRLAGLARSLGLAYTRYADDLVFSGNDVGVAGLLATVRRIVRDEGFSLREDKTRVATASARQRVGGWVVNRSVNVPRAELERLEAILVNCVRHGPHGQDRRGHPDFRAHLQGRIAWVRSARPDRATALERHFRAIAWE